MINLVLFSDKDKHDKSCQNGNMYFRNLFEINKKYQHLILSMRKNHEIV